MFRKTPPSETLWPAAGKDAAKDTAGLLTLVEQDGQFDIVLEQDGLVRSVRALGMDIKAAVLDDGALHHLVVMQDGYQDHFLFQNQAQGGGKIVWATRRIMRDESGTMLSARCWPAH